MNALPPRGPALDGRRWLFDNVERDSLLIGPNAFGHPGFGRAIGFADPDHGLAYG